MQPEHSRYLSPSNAPVWVHCAGSPKMVEKYKRPSTRSTESVEEGQAVRWLATECLKREHVKPTDKIDSTAPNGRMITKVMADSAQMFYDDVVAKAGLMNPHTWIEKKMFLPYIHEDCFGVPVVIHFNPETWELIVWDFRNGWELVEAYMNWKLICYAASVMMLVVDKNPANMPRIELRIVQPGPSHPNGRCRSWFVTREELTYLCDQLKVAARMAYDVSELKEGAHCKNCAARVVCPSQRGAALSAYSTFLKMDAVEIPPDCIGHELRTLIQLRDNIDTRITALEQEVKTMLYANKQVPPYSLETTNSNLKWNKPKGELKVLEQLTGVKITKEADFMTPLQAIAAGMNEDMVNLYSERKPTGFRITDKAQNRTKELLSK